MEHSIKATFMCLNFDSIEDLTKMVMGFYHILKKAVYMC